MSKILLSELLSQVVVYQNGKKPIGVVGDVIFSEDMSKIKSLVIFDMDTESQEGLVDSENISAVTGEQVVLKSGAKIEKTTEPIIHNNPINNNVTTTDGNIIGTVRDVELDGLRCSSLCVGGELRIEPAFIATRTPRYIILKSQHAKGFFIQNSPESDLSGIKNAVEALKKNQTGSEAALKEDDTLIKENTKNEDCVPLRQNQLNEKDAVSKINTLFPEPDKKPDSAPAAALKAISTNKKAKPAAPKKQEIKSDIVVPSEETIKHTETETATQPQDNGDNIEEKSVLRIKAVRTTKKKETALNEPRESNISINKHSTSEPKSEEIIGGTQRIEQNDFVIIPYKQDTKPTPEFKKEQPVINKSDSTESNANLPKEKKTDGDINITAAEMLKSSPLYKKAGSRKKPPVEERQHIPARIIADFAFLLGRIVIEDIQDLAGNVLISKGTLIVVDTVRTARNHLKLLDLTIKSRV